METRQVLKVEMAGAVTSFRYPYFSHGFQPTYEMPPPSTIYGHICSAVGDWVQTDNLEFGYHFTHSGKFIDHKEYLYFDDPIQPFPFDRELLFNPRLTLYLASTDLSPLFEAFRSPRYPVVLGRSQDLMTYLSVRIVELWAAAEGYFENTLLPLEIAPHLDQSTVAITMCRYINPRRVPEWETYAMLSVTALWPPDKQEPSPFDDEDEALIFDSPTYLLWVDPASPEHQRRIGSHCAVWLHGFR